MIDDRIAQADYIIDETYYLFSDERLSKRYLKHIMLNSSNIDEVIRRIKRIQDRVITLSNYANDGIARLNDYADTDEIYETKVIEKPNFEKIDKFYDDDKAQSDFGEYLKNEAPTAQLKSTTRQCEFIRISCNQMMKQARSYYLGLKKHEIRAKEISDLQNKQRQSMDLGIYRNLKV